MWPCDKPAPSFFIWYFEFAAHDKSGRRFLLRSKFCLFEVVFSYLRPIYPCIKTWKILYKMRYESDPSMIYNKWFEWERLSATLRDYSVAYIHIPGTCNNSEKKFCKKIREECYPSEINNKWLEWQRLSFTTKSVSLARPEAMCIWSWKIFL